VPSPLDPDVVRKFHFTREMVEGPIYRKYEKAIRKVWSVEDLDFTRDAQDWERIDETQRRGLLGVTVRFLAGEQNVTDELVPMLAAAHALRRFDWTMFLSTFLMEEAKHAEFFMRWHERVVGVVEPEEVARHFLVRGKTIDPSGRFEVRDVLHEALPYYGQELMEASMGGTEAEIERAFVAFSAAYNSFVEGVLTMPSYEIVIDTTDSWNAFPTLKQGFRLTRARS
jgi:ribonucleoside-diphosphate reductase beta chain